MRNALICILFTTMAAGAAAHPFDDRALMHTNLAIVNDRDVVLTILYNFTGAAASYTELWKLDSNQDGFVSLAERDKRMLALAQERLDNVELKINGKRLKLNIDPRSFQCLDMDHPERDFSGEQSFPTDRASLGYAMGFKGTVTEAPASGAFLGEFGFLSVGERIEDPALQFKVYDERVKPAATLSDVTWDKRANGPYVFSFRYLATTMPVNGETSPPPEPTPEPKAQAARDELDKMRQAPREDKNREGFFRKLFDNLRSGEGDFSYWFFALAFVFGWGAWHALQPGHGKTLVASYLIGTQGRKSDALFLGLVVTLAHTSGVMILLGGLAAVQAWMPDLFEDPTKSLSEWISVAVGATILFMGAGLLLKRAGGETRHEHDIFGRHVHGEDDHAHQELDPQLMSRWEILRLGILGGIVPCPAAFVIALISIDRQMLVAGLILVLVFSLGLALVLSTIGLMLVATKGYMRARRKERRGAAYRFFETKVPVIGALVIVLLGFTMVLMGLLRLGVLDLATFTA